MERNKSMTDGMTVCNGSTSSLKSETISVDCHHQLCLCNGCAKLEPMKCTYALQFGLLNHNHRTMHNKHKAGRGHYSGAIGIIKEIGAESNAHGFAKIATSRHYIRAIFWSIFVGIGFIAAIVQLSMIVMKYLDFQVVEVSKIRYGMPVLYPSVTVCSLAAVSLAKAKARMKLPDSDTVKWIQFTTSVQYERLASLQGFYENIQTEAEILAYNISDFILHCTFNKKKCTVDNFTIHFDGSHYYNCFTFNRGGSEEEDDLLMQATGPQYGLSLILALDNDDPPLTYYGVYNIRSNIENSAGVRVTVHEPNTIPFPIDQGFDVPPGYTMSVSLKASLHSRLSKPHGNCTTNLLSGELSYKHTIFSCLQVCQQEIVIKKCGCKASGLPNPTKARNLTSCGYIKDWRQLHADAYARAEDEYYDIMRSRIVSSLNRNETSNMSMSDIVIEADRWIDLLKTHDYEQSHFDNMTMFSVTIEELDKLLNLLKQNDTSTISRVDLWINRTRHINLHLNISNPNNVLLKDLRCEEDVLYNLANDRSYEKSCKCYQPCSELRYEKSISLSYWPLEFYQYHMLKLLLGERMHGSFLKDAYEYLENLTKIQTFLPTNKLGEEARDKQLKSSKLIRQNLVRLNIYIEDLSVVEFIQMPAYEIADLFADIGGTLGLWMGISVLTFMELMELLIRLFGLLVHRERKPDRTIGNGSAAIEREYSYEPTYDTDLETPV